MKTLKGFFSKVAGYFQSGKAAAVFDQVAKLVEEATPIVATIEELTPNRTVKEIANAYLQFGVPLIRTVDDTPAEQRGYLLLNLATTVLGRKYPNATNVLNSAVQLAVTGLKAK